MMSVAASDPSGGAMVALEAIHHVSCITLERYEPRARVLLGLKLCRTRFQTLVEDMEKPNVTENYIQNALQFILNLVNNAEDLNMLVYLQMDLERAGFQDLIEVGDLKYGSQLAHNLL